MSVKEDTLLAPKNSGETRLEKKAKGEAQYSARCKMVREVVHKMNETAAWDHVQARDVPMEVIDFVAERLSRGCSPGEVCKQLGLNPVGGKNSRQWKKIQAYFRQGFRADAEAFLVQQTHDYYKVLQKTKEVLEDAFENGTPVIQQKVVEDRESGIRSTTTEVVQVKGATKELAGFIETYSKAIATLPKLWKDYGAISDGVGKNAAAGQGGVTIVVKTNVPMHSQAEIDEYRRKMLEKQKPVIDVSPKKADDGKPQT